MKSKITIIIILAIVATVAVVLKLQNNKKNLKQEVFAPKTKQTSASAESLGVQIFEKNQNPVKDEIPAANPFKENTANPLKDSYKNPFE